MSVPLSNETTGERTSCRAGDLHRRVQSVVNGLENPFPFVVILKGVRRAYHVCPPVFHEGIPCLSPCLP
jgi:hypothetical protein